MKEAFMGLFTALTQEQKKMVIALLQEIAESQSCESSMSYSAVQSNQAPAT